MGLPSTKYADMPKHTYLNLKNVAWCFTVLKISQLM